MLHIAKAIWLETQFQLFIDEMSRLTTYPRAGWNRRAWFLNVCVFDDTTPRNY